MYDQSERLFKQQFDLKLGQNKSEYEKLEVHFNDVVKKLKNAVAKDNQTILSLSNNILNLYNKYKD